MSAGPLQRPVGDAGRRLRRGGWVVLLLAAIVSGKASGPAQAAPQREGAVPVSCTTGARSWLVPFETAPFPYEGEIPDGGGPFLDQLSGGRRGHTSPRGGVYWEDTTYSDNRVLLSVPFGFDPSARPVIVLFLHGNEARLERDVCRRQGVPRQLVASGLNAVLVAPQLAVDALDSSAGRFWQRGALRAFLTEAADQLARLGHPGLEGAPVIIAAYSGGYLPAVFGLQVGGVAERVRALILLDALFGEVDRFGDTVAANLPHMAFVSAYTSASKAANAALRANLARRGVAIGEGIPGVLKPGVATFVPAPASVSHGEFMTRGFAPDPLRLLLGKLSGVGATTVGTTAR